MESLRIERTIEWDGVLGAEIEIPAERVSIAVSPKAACRRAGGYLAMEVGLFFRPGEPRLVVVGRPLWRMAITLHLPEHGVVGVFDEIDVDATGGDVLPLTQSHIDDIQKRAHEIASHLTWPGSRKMS